MFYSALFEPDPEGGIMVTFPDFGFATHGDNQAEAYDMAQDLLVHVLSDRIAEMRDLPHRGKPHGKSVRAVTVPALAAAKVALYEELRSAGVTRNELARRIGQPEQQIERLLDLHHQSTIDQLETAFGALGKRMVITLEDAA